MREILIGLRQSVYVVRNIRGTFSYRKEVPQKIRILYADVEPLRERIDGSDDEMYAQNNVSQSEEIFA